MSYEIIYCCLQGHQSRIIVNICKELYCKRNNRYICIQCLRLKLHSQCCIRHRQSPVISQDDLAKKQLYYEHKIEYYHSIVQKIQYLESLYNEFQQYDMVKQTINPILELQKYYNKQKHYLLNIIEAYKLQKESTLKLNYKQQRILQNLNKHIINQEDNVYQRIIRKIISNEQKQKISNIHQKIGKQQFSDTIKIIMERLRKFKNRIQYQIQFKQFSHKMIEKLSVSPNDKYIAVITNRNELNIVEINKNQTIRQKKFQFFISMVQFDQNSNFLIVSCYQTLYFYQFFHGFKCIKKLSTINIYNFISISLKEIIIYNSYMVKIIDFDNATHLQISINEPLELIVTMEYDKLNKTIVTSAYDGKIIFFSITGQLLIIKKVEGKKVYITQLQLIKNNQQLLSKDQKELKLWQISYQQQQLDLIQMIDHQGIYNMFSNFIFDNDEQILYLINEQIINKLNLNFMILETLDITCPRGSVVQYDNDIIGQSSSKKFHLFLSIGMHLLIIGTIILITRTMLYNE